MQQFCFFKNLGDCSDTSLPALNFSIFFSFMVCLVIFTGAVVKMIFTVESTKQLKFQIFFSFMVCSVHTQSMSLFYTTTIRGQDLFFFYGLFSCIDVGGCEDDVKRVRSSKQWEDPILAHRQHSLQLHSRPQTVVKVRIFKVNSLDKETSWEGL